MRRLTNAAGQRRPPKHQASAAKCTISGRTVESCGHSTRLAQARRPAAPTPIVAVNHDTERHDE
jgi:hypothetical protein